jgi:hypothetical protein
MRRHSIRRLRRLVIPLLLIGMTTPYAAAGVVSDGSDGPFTPTGLTTLDLPSDGVFNFTTVNISEGATVKFNRNAANTPVCIAATGDVVIDGVIDVSAVATNVIVIVPENPKRTAGPGGYDGGGGATGDPSAIGENGDGPGGGGGGYSAGGAGNATEGNQPTKYSTTGGMGFAGPVVDYPDPFAGGSGGGGGSAINRFGWYAGGFGGGGGGALEICTPGQIFIGGRIFASGANGGWAHASVLAYGGAGGGGSGGNIALSAHRIILGESGRLAALGGYGGGLSTQPYSHDPAAYSSGADGGMGYARLVAADTLIDGVVDAVLVLVEPCEGDLDGNQVGDIVDVAQFAFHFGRNDCGPSGTCPGDLEPDGDQDGVDLALLAADLNREDCP